MVNLEEEEGDRVEAERPENQRGSRIRKVISRQSKKRGPTNNEGGREKIDKRN